MGVTEGNGLTTGSSDANISSIGSASPVVCFHNSEVGQTGLASRHFIELWV
jgi:hypothetical protein